eukprot:TRINITY_DN23029_c0_g1_i1.p1 TRINITY_DN23029_c0_g1~~TRINITY_DN23029_c0_g1_i1.p1  ORF type:complete len:388 (+),score=183.73 TRINITY_DN23029_c0_g1_i1:103-1266(+)
MSHESQLQDAVHQETTEASRLVDRVSNYPIVHGVLYRSKEYYAKAKDYSALVNSVAAVIEPAVGSGLSAVEPLLDSAPVRPLLGVANGALDVAEHQASRAKQFGQAQLATAAAALTAAAPRMAASYASAEATVAAAAKPLDDYLQHTRLAQPLHRALEQLDAAAERLLPTPPSDPAQPLIADASADGPLAHAGKTLKRRAVGAAVKLQELVHTEDVTGQAIRLLQAIISGLAASMAATEQQVSSSLSPRQLSETVRQGLAASLAALIDFAELLQRRYPMAGSAFDNVKARAKSVSERLVVQADDLADRYRTLKATVSTGAGQLQEAASSLTSQLSSSVPPPRELVERVVPVLNSLLDALTSLLISPKPSAPAGSGGGEADPAFVSAK